MSPLSHPAGDRRELFRRRHLVDRESGALLVWLPGDEVTRSEVAELAPAVQTGHRAGGVTVEATGAGVWQCGSPLGMELGAIEAAFLDL